MKSRFSTLLAIALIVVFASDDSMLFGTNSAVEYVYFRIAYDIFALLILALSRPYSKSNDCVPFMLIIFGIALTMVANLDFRLGYGMQFLTIAIAYRITVVLPPREFFFWFQKAMFWFVVLSTIVFFSTAIDRGFLSYFPLVNNYAGEQFYNIFGFVVFANENIMRNCGIFREPGVFAFYLIVCALVNNLNYKPKIRTRNLLSWIVGLITTQSSAGFIAIVLLLFARIKMNARRTLLFIGVAVASIVVSVDLNVSIVGNFLEKFNSESATYGSFLARLYGMVVPVYIGILNIPFGSGLTRFVELYPEFSYSLTGLYFSTEGEATNTLFNLFAIFGFLVFFPTVIGLLKFCMFVERKLFQRLFVIAAMMCILFSQDFRFSILFYLLIFYGFDFVRKNTHMNESLSSI